MIDTHCHLFDPPLSPGETLPRLAGSQVTGVVCVATHLASWEPMAAGFGEVSSALQHAYLGLGLHPWFVSEATPGWPERLRTLLGNADAVGEIGLDRGDRAPGIELQMEPFGLQMELAEEMEKPALLHVVRAHDLVLGHLSGHPKVRGIIHAFSGSPQEAAAYIDRGWLLGIGGGIARENAHRLRRIVKGLPLSALVLETDSPYMWTPGSPAGSSWPGEVVGVAEHLARLLDEPLERVAAVTTRNLTELFQR